MSNLFIFLIILILEAEARPSDSDVPSRQNLILDRIYNSTQYNAELESILRQYNADNSLHNNNDSRVSEASNPILVGFAGDPFGYSVTIDDYLNGTRDMDPQVYRNTTEHRSKRSLLQLYSMVYCVTDCDPFSYVNYGCYCGFLGSGTPVDTIDRCCQDHDECYGRSDIWSIGQYMDRYLWRCDSGCPWCADEQTQGISARLCECDREFSLCLNKYVCPSMKPACATARYKPKRKK